MRTQVAISGGLNVTVEFTPGRAEPDVGIMSDYVEDWDIVEIAGRPLRNGEKCDWLYRRIAKGKDEDRILDACYEAMSNEGDYDYDD